MNLTPRSTSPAEDHSMKSDNGEWEDEEDLDSEELTDEDITAEELFSALEHLLCPCPAQKNTFEPLEDEEDDRMPFTMDVRGWSLVDIVSDPDGFQCALRESMHFSDDIDFCFDGLEPSYAQLDYEALYEMYEEYMEDLKSSKHNPKFQALGFGEWLKRKTKNTRKFLGATVKGAAIGCGIGAVTGLATGVNPLVAIPGCAIGGLIGTGFGVKNGIEQVRSQ